MAFSISQVMVLVAARSAKFAPAEFEYLFIYFILWLEFEYFVG